MKTTIKTLHGVKTLRYRYAATSDMSFDFQLLSEVGQPWYTTALGQALDLANEHACTLRRGVTLVDTSDKFVMCDVLIPNNSKGGGDPRFPLTLLVGQGAGSPPLRGGSPSLARSPVSEPIRAQQAQPHPSKPNPTPASPTPPRQAQPT